MKRTALTGLFLTAALLASPVFAADDLCGSNLQQIKDALTTAGTNMGPDTKMNLEDTHKQAMAAQAAGNDKKCIELTTKALQESDKTDTGGGEGSSK